MGNNGKRWETRRDDEKRGEMMRNDGGQWGLRSIFRGADAPARHHRRQSAKQLVQPDVSDARFCVQAVRRKGETGIVADSLYKRNAHSRYFMYKQFLQHHRE